MNRRGYYCWAGPGTIRMLNLKYFNPAIDIASLLNSYDLPYLSEIKEKFCITDFWASYSWGFSNKTEKEDRQFLIERLPNFKKLNINLHAYIQGPNVVYSEFLDKNWYARDNQNRYITYHRGRRVVCLNNVEFLDYKIRQIQEMNNYSFDGIFMDNIQMGQLGVPIGKNKSVFAGCNCKTCRELFFREFNEKIPVDFAKNPTLTNLYLKFRVESTNRFLTKVAEMAHQSNKQFGTNSFDPKYESDYVYGTDLSFIDSVQDYLLFENLHLPNEEKNNKYISPITKKLKKPVFVISYDKGIGFDDKYSQKEVNTIYSEDYKEPFYSCLKGSEYVSNGIWHNLIVSQYSKPEVNRHFKEKSFKPRSKIYMNPIFIYLLKKLYNPLFTLYMENKFVRKLLGNTIFRFV